MAPTALKFYREVVLLCFLCIYNADSFASWHMQNISFCAKIFVTPPSDFEWQVMNRSAYKQGTDRRGSAEFDSFIRMFK